MSRHYSFAVGRAEKIRQPCDFLEAKEREIDLHWYALAISILASKSSTTALMLMGIDPPQPKAVRHYSPKGVSIFDDCMVAMYFLTKVCGMKLKEVGRYYGFNDQQCSSAIQRYKKKQEEKKNGKVPKRVSKGN